VCGTVQKTNTGIDAAIARKVFQIDGCEKLLLIVHQYYRRPRGSIDDGFDEERMSVWFGVG